jgi:hypothetical protein
LPAAARAASSDAAMVLSGCFRPILRSSCLEAIAIFGQIDRVDAGAEDGRAFVGERLREFQRRLPAELHDQTLHRAARFSVSTISSTSSVVSGSK